MLGEANSELAEQGFLLGGWFGDPPQSDFAAVGGRQNDVGALEGGEQGDCPHRRHGLGVIDAADRWLRFNLRPALEQMFEGDPQGITEECDHDVSFYARLQLVKQGPDGKLALQRPE